MKVKSLKIRQIFASTGKYEVASLPVDKSLLKFDIIKRHFTREQLADQKEVDQLLRIIDKTPNFKEIGGNVALAISSAFLKAFALEENQEIFQFLSKKHLIKPPSVPYIKTV